MKSDSEIGLAHTCDHANEMPRGKCKCSSYCYCKSHTCKAKPKVQKEGEERVFKAFRRVFRDRGGLNVPFCISLIRKELAAMDAEEAANR